MIVSTVVQRMDKKELGFEAAMVLASISLLFFFALTFYRCSAPFSPPLFLVLSLSRYSVGVVLEVGHAYTCVMVKE